MWFRASRRTRWAPGCSSPQPPAEGATVSSTKPGSSSSSTVAPAARAVQSTWQERSGLERKHRTDEGTVAENYHISLRVIIVKYQTTHPSFLPPTGIRAVAVGLSVGRLACFSSGRLNGSSSRGSGRAVGGRGREPAIRGRSIRWCGHGRWS